MRDSPLPPITINPEVGWQLSPVEGEPRTTTARARTPEARLIRTLSELQHRPGVWHRIDSHRVHDKWIRRTIEAGRTLYGDRLLVRSVHAVYYLCLSE